METIELKIEPYMEDWQEIELNKEIISLYALNKWAEDFSLMTAGYRDQLNPTDASDPGVAFNSLTVAILGEAKARVFEQKNLTPKEMHVHIGGETRPHTQEFIAILSRIYAAHNIKVHLRNKVSTTPIWYSSFGVFYEEYDSGDNLTASHSPFFKGGWKPMDSSGKQLLEEEEEIISEVKRIIRNRDTIKLAPWNAENIINDFDIDEPYIKYQQLLITRNLSSEITRAFEKGFRCTVCTVGGSMKATTERLFPKLEIPLKNGNAEAGGIRYIFGEEDSFYHGIGQLNGEHFGPDPSKPQVYKNIGAQESLINGNADIVFLWDPDGDRFNIVTIADKNQSHQARTLGLEVDSYTDNKSIVYFTPNQLYFMLTAYRINVLKKEGLKQTYDWFVTLSIPTSRSIAEIAEAEGLSVAQVRVGFKYIGTFSEWLENRTNPNEPFINAIREKVYLGKNPRALIMCEESGGAVFGGAEMLLNKSASKGLIALREKDGMQFGLMILSLATYLYNSKRSFAEYYCSLIEQYNIQNRFYNRRDVRLYDESLTGTKRLEAIARGVEKRDGILGFFSSLARKASQGLDTNKILDEINFKLPMDSTKLQGLQSINMIGEGKLLEGTILEFSDFWFIIRASGTDALLRYYIEGKNKTDINKYLQSFINLEI